MGGEPENTLAQSKNHTATLPDLKAHKNSLELQLSYCKVDVLYQMLKNFQITLYCDKCGKEVIYMRDQVGNDKHGSASTSGRKSVGDRAIIISALLIL